MAAAGRSLPKVEGDLTVAGLEAPVEVLRDRWGVPHIYADSLDDLYFAQGFVAATERLFQIDFQFRLATGRLATMFGPPALSMDTFARTVGWNRAGRRIARDMWDERSREITGAWWSGVLAAAGQMSATPPAEYVALGGLEPDLPPLERVADELASAAVLMSWWLCGNADPELLRRQIG